MPLNSINLSKNDYKEKLTKKTTASSSGEFSFPIIFKICIVPVFSQAIFKAINFGALGSPTGSASD